MTKSIFQLKSSLRRMDWKWHIQHKPFIQKRGNSLPAYELFEYQFNFIAAVQNPLKVFIISMFILKNGFFVVFLWFIGKTIYRIKVIIYDRHKRNTGNCLSDYGCHCTGSFHQTAY